MRASFSRFPVCARPSACSEASFSALSSIRSELFPNGSAVPREALTLRLEKLGPFALEITVELCLECG
jgi:hypothetical protein